MINNFPIQINEIKIEDDLMIEKEIKIGTILKVKLLNGTEFYYGIYLGKIATELDITHNPDTNVLNILKQFNDLIFVPDLKETFTGNNCWWIEYEKDGEGNG